MKVTAFVGLNDQHSKIQEIATEVAMNQIQASVAEFFPYGGTVSQAKGVFSHADGTLVIENSIRIELFLDDVSGVKQFLTTVKTLLNQESILVEYSKPTVEFI